MGEDVNWIEWKGGDCPVDGDTLVEVQFGARDFQTGKARWFDGGAKYKPSAWKQNGPHEGWIIRYRLAQMPPDDVRVRALMNMIDKELSGVKSPDNRGALLKQARDLLSLTAASRQVVPDGWRLVPVKETEAEIEAGVDFAFERDQAYRLRRERLCAGHSSRHDRRRPTASRLVGGGRLAQRWHVPQMWSMPA